MKMTRKIISMVITMAMVFAFGFNSVNASTYNSGIEAFVNSLYSDCLGRSADPTGFNDWCNKLSTGQVSGKQCAYGFFFSPEFQAKAGRISADELINTYYKVFLNRDADPAGKTYWSGKIASTSTADDIIILFNGFADSVEFANKCASYGITVGTANTPAVGTTSTTSTQTTNTNNLAAQTNGTRANSVEELDAYWTSQGYEVMYIDLGNGASQKVYAHFYDMTEHNNQVNAWRNQNGLPSLTLITDPNDVRYQFARTRAIEVAYRFSHRRPLDIAQGAFGTAPEGEASENIANGVTNTSIEVFRNSSLHNTAMLLPDTSLFVTTSCNVVFVNPDGITTTTTSSSGGTTGTGRSTVQLFYY